MSGVGRRVGAGVATWAVAAVAVVAAVHPERCGAVDVGAVDAAVRGAVDWFAANAGPDGEILYQWDRDADRAPGGRNIVRHAGAVLSLYQAAGAGVPGARETADRALAWTLDHLVDTPVGPALTLGDPAPTGATALLVAALVERDRAGATVDDELLGALGATLLATVDPRGRVAADIAVATGPVRTRTSPFFPGEVAWALARLDARLQGRGFGAAADRVLAWLITERDEVERPWPPVSDHWAAYARAERAAAGAAVPEGVDDAALAAWRRRQLGLFGLQVRYESQKTGGVTRWTRGSVAMAAGVGTLGEGLGRWLELDAATGELGGDRAAVEERLVCVAALLVARQVDEADAGAEPQPERVVGAWFQRGRTRIDDQQHALSALLAARPVLARRAALGEGGRP